jgi:hypothetical protein
MFYQESCLNTSIGGVMLKKILLIFLFISAYIIPNACTSQNNKHTAATFAVRIFSSANFMGYLEPCG